MENAPDIVIGQNLQVPMPTVISFVRQLSHDLRNHLNALELQSAFINEIAADTEVKDEIKRLRSMLGQMTKSLQQISTSLASVRLAEMPYEASLFLEDLQKNIATEFSGPTDTVEWEAKVTGTVMKIDPQLLQQALIELFANAFKHERGEGALRATAVTENGKFVFTLREPKTNFAGSLASWSREPFQKLSHGHYGLGLLRARTIIEAHGGRFDVRYDPGFLLTTIALPLDA